MDQQQRSIRFGAALIACALVLRLGGSGVFDAVGKLLTKPNIAPFLLYLETGRIVRFSQSSEELPAFALESALPDFARSAREPLRFLPEDAETVRVKYNCSVSPDLSELITRPLDWDLTEKEPAVLILHTHTTESYTKQGETYQETAAFRTLDEDYNMLSIGDRVAALLEAGGITVIHDRALHDYPSYNGSYSDARSAIQGYLSEYPSIRLILDLHRDASGDDHNQLRTHAVVQGMDSAQLMLVVGTGVSGLGNPHWEENLALALKLHVQAEKTAPGIMRYVNLRGQRFNQDLAPGMLLVEVGAAGNSHPEALIAAEVLAQGILSLARGSGN